MSGVALAPASAGARVPSGFVGVMADGPVAEPGFDPAAELRTMVRTGVETVRVVFHWTDAQPYRRIEEVPVDQGDRFRDIDGVPTDFTRYDPLIANAALRRLEVLPVVTTAPAWAAKYPGQFASPPSDLGAYASFARALVHRYGPRGAFWAENPDLPRRPLRSWQIWNEPNLRASWSDARWRDPYVRLLRAGRRAIVAADPGAKIVLAGLSNYSWRSLAAIYRGRRARGLFDEVAIHPYTRDVKGLGILLRRVRTVMRRNGDRRKPIAVTEFGWPSAAGKAVGFGIETTERGQARRAARALRLLARLRRPLGISRVYWYNWLTREDPQVGIFDFSGLRRLGPDGTGVPKPAQRAFRRTALRLESCRRKSAVATRCARRRR